MFRSIAVRKKALCWTYEANVIYGLDWLLGSFALVVPIKRGCSLPTISAPEEGAHAFVRSDNAKQLFDVRLNGVKAICTRHGRAARMVALSVGLKTKAFAD